MEFTTRFGLHSQATRLRGERTPAGRGPLPACHRPWAEPPSEGLRPPAPHRENALFRTLQFPRPERTGIQRRATRGRGRHARRPYCAAVSSLTREHVFSTTLQPPRPGGTGFQRWSLPSSLAATGGILVSFFSSA